MHIQLTDILACPRCTADSGLIVRSDAMHDRRIREGLLGCPQCRAQYPIRDGIAMLTAETAASERHSNELRVLDAAPPDHGGAAPGNGDARHAAAIRMAALLGAGTPLGFAIVAGPAVHEAAALAALAEDTEIIALARPGDAMPAEEGPVSRVWVHERLPFHARRVRAVWLGGETADALLEEGARILHPVGRLILEPAPADAESRLEATGLRIVARQDRTVLAVHASGAPIASGNEPSLS